MFQFQNGAIKRPTPVFITSHFALFQNGAIKRFSCFKFLSLKKVVSIPKWCD